MRRPEVVPSHGRNSYGLEFDASLLWRTLRPGVEGVSSVSSTFILEKQERKTDRCDVGPTRQKKLDWMSVEKTVEIVVSPCLASCVKGGHLQVLHLPPLARAKIAGGEQVRSVVAPTSSFRKARA